MENKIKIQKLALIKFLLMGLMATNFVACKNNSRPVPTPESPGDGVNVFSQSEVENVVRLKIAADEADAVFKDLQDEYFALKNQRDELAGPDAESESSHPYLSFDLIKMNAALAGLRNAISTQSEVTVNKYNKYKEALRECASCSQTALDAVESSLEEKASLEKQIEDVELSIVEGSGALEHLNDTMVALNEDITSLEEQREAIMYEISGLDPTQNGDQNRELEQINNEIVTKNRLLEKTLREQRMTFLALDVAVAEKQGLENRLQNEF